MNNKFGIIPLSENKEELYKMVDLAEAQGLFFEYNDFYNPFLLEDREELDKRISLYLDIKRDRSMDTLHGAFFDMNPASDDPGIMRIVNQRYEASLYAAERLGVKGIVFHTNYITNFKLIGYRRDWVSRSTEFYSKLLEKHPNMEIYVENMFDEDPLLLLELAREMEGYDNFGICFDYAHSRVFGHDPEDFTHSLAPYVKHMHINDNTGLSDDHMALGDGNTDWSLFKQHMSEHNLDRKDISVLIELRGMEKINRSLAFLKANL